MIYKFKNNELQLLLLCYNKYNSLLSPIVRANVSNLISTLQSDGTIYSIDQIDTLLCLLVVVEKKDEEDLENVSQKQIKSDIEETVSNKKNDVIVLLENIRLFRQHFDLDSTQKNTLQR